VRTIGTALAHPDQRRTGQDTVYCIPNEVNLLAETSNQPLTALDCCVDGIRLPCCDDLKFHDHISLLM
jgi:hypothetical protein